MRGPASARAAAQQLRAGTLVLAASAALAVGGCGGGQHAASAKPVHSPQLVYMYEIVPLNQLYQTVTIDADGSGVVAYFIGEVAGVDHHPFRLAPSALPRLRRLVAAVRTTSIGPTHGADLHKYAYTIEANGETIRVIQGQVPRPLSPLVAYLSGLIARYS